jgi:hypothetical protein
MLCFALAPASFDKSTRATSKQTVACAAIIQRRPVYVIAKCPLSAPNIRFLEAFEPEKKR